MGKLKQRTAYLLLTRPVLQGEEKKFLQNGMAPCSFAGTKRSMVAHGGHLILCSVAKHFSFKIKIISILKVKSKLNQFRIHFKSKTIFHLRVKPFSFLNQKQFQNCFWIYFTFDAAQKGQTQITFGNAFERRWHKRATVKFSHANATYDKTQQSSGSCFMFSLSLSVYRPPT